MILRKTHSKERTAGLILIAGIMIVYWQVRHHFFINFDDDQYIYANPYIKNGLTWTSVKWALGAVYAANWHPLTWISHMIDISLFGMNAGWHHMTNVFFHILNSLMIFYIFHKITRLFWHSFLLAALFAFHPMHVESVTWVAERKDVLSTFFWALTIWCYLRYVEQPGLKRYLLIIVFFIFGLMSKPMLVTLPFLLLLIDFWPLRRFEGRSGSLGLTGFVLEKIPLFILSGMSSIVTLIAQKSGGAVVPIEESPLMIRMANSMIAYMDYLYKMFLPFDLAIPYPYPASVSYGRVFAAVIVVATITILCVRFVKSYPYLIVGWLWYLGTLLPVIGLIQIGHQAMADRYTYIPFIGIYIAVIWGVSDLTSKYRYRRVFYCSAGTAVLFFFIVISRVQVGYWKNSMTLFAHATKVTTNNFAAQLNLGVGLGEQGKTEKAISHYREALKIFPKYAMAHYNLGLALEHMNKPDEAAGHYREAIKIAPNYKKAYLNLGINLAEQGKIEEALHYYSEALCIDPEYILAHQNVAILLSRQGKYAEALDHYFKILSLDPSLVSVYVSIAYILENQGKINEAIGYYQEALHIDPKIEVVHYNMGIALVKQGKYDEAAYHYSEAIKLNPGDAEIYNNLATTMIRLGKIDAAIHYFQQALSIKPDYTVARQNLDKTLEAKKNILYQKESKANGQ